MRADSRRPTSGVQVDSPESSTSRMLTNAPRRSRFLAGVSWIGICSQGRATIRPSAACAARSRSRRRYGGCTSKGLPPWHAPGEFVGETDCREIAPSRVAVVCRVSNPPARRALCRRELRWLFASIDRSIDVSNESPERRGTEASAAAASALVSRRASRSGPCSGISGSRGLSAARLAAPCRLGTGSRAIPATGVAGAGTRRRDRAALTGGLIR